jgi:hypothetical protein
MAEATVVNEVNTPEVRQGMRGHQMITPEKTEAQRRKECPMYLGLLVYFPDALEQVSNVSFVAGKQHHPGEPVHWDRKKSSDEPDALLRHLKDRAKGEQFDTDGARHLAKVAWRALAMLQKEIEGDLNGNG